MMQGIAAEQEPTIDAQAPGSARWPGGWVRALLPTAILACLEQQPLHGYAIAQALGKLGLGIPRGGALYPVLTRLEDSGEVDAEWTPGTSGPPRRQYTLTSRGAERLGKDRLGLEAMAAAISPTTGSIVESDERTPL